MRYNKFVQQEIINEIFPQELLLNVLNGKLPPVPTPLPEANQIRNNLNPDEQRFCVLPGEHIYADLRVGLPDTAFTVRFPSGYKKVAKQEEIEKILEIELHLSKSQISLFIKFAFANRRIAFWPHEMVVRTVVVLTDRRTQKSVEYFI